MCQFSGILYHPKGEHYCPIHRTDTFCKHTVWCLWNAQSDLVQKMFYSSNVSRMRTYNASRCSTLAWSVQGPGFDSPTPWTRKTKINKMNQLWWKSEEWLPQEMLWLGMDVQGRLLEGFVHTCVPFLLNPWEAPGTFILECIGLYTYTFFFTIPYAYFLWLIKTKYFI